MSGKKKSLSRNWYLTKIFCSSQPTICLELLIAFHNITSLNWTFFSAHFLYLLLYWYQSWGGWEAGLLWENVTSTDVCFGMRIPGLTENRSVRKQEILILEENYFMYFWKLGANLISWHKGTKKIACAFKILCMVRCSQKHCQELLWLINTVVPFAWKCITWQMNEDFRQSSLIRQNIYLCSHLLYTIIINSNNK